MLARIRTLLELIRFSHTVFALPFALLAAVLAWNEADSVFRWEQLLGVVLCMVFARSAAMAFNRIVDTDIDGENPRTAGRHLPAGLVGRRSVVAFMLVCSAGFIASTLLFLPNRWPIYLSLRCLYFLLSYSFAKRWTSLCHYWLSAALMLAPIATWIAIRGDVSAVPLLLAAAIFFWVGGFDIIYACQDADFDRTRGLKSLPARLGIEKSLRIALLSHIAMIVCLFALWYVSSLGIVFFTGILFVAALLIWEHRLVRPDDLTRVNIAFFNVNAVVSLGLLFVGILDLALR